MPDDIPPPPPTPTPSTPATTTPPSIGSPETTGLAPNVAAGLACLIPLIGGIVFLVLEKKDKFVRFYAMQSVFFWGAGFVFGTVIRIMMTILSFIPWLGALLNVLLFLVWLLVGLVGFAIWIILLIKSFSGKEWEIPFLGPLARKQLEPGRLGGS